MRLLMFVIFIQVYTTSIGLAAGLANGLLRNSLQQQVTCLPSCDPQIFCKTSLQPLKTDVHRQNEVKCFFFESAKTHFRKQLFEFFSNMLLPIPQKSLNFDQYTSNSVDNSPKKDSKKEFVECDY